MSLGLDYRQSSNDPLENLAYTKAEPSSALDTTTIIATSTTGLTPEEEEEEKHQEFMKTVAALKNVEPAEEDTDIDKRSETNVPPTNEPQANTRDNGSHISRCPSPPTFASGYTATPSDRRLPLPGWNRAASLGQPGRLIDRLTRSTRKPPSSKGSDSEEDEGIQEHLDKYVKEVRVAKPLRDPVPTREMFTTVEPETGAVKMNWVEYSKSVGIFSKLPIFLSLPPPS